jgi:hypothetical protein
MHEFVEPAIVKLPLSGGRYLIVKQRLNAGESRRWFARMLRDLSPGEKLRLDPAKIGLTKLCEYLVDWSFTDPTGKPVPISEAALDNLESDLYAEIVAAVDAHEAAEAVKREAEKNAQDGGTNSVPISPSAAT